MRHGTSHRPCQPVERGRGKLLHLLVLLQMLWICGAGATVDHSTLDRLLNEYVHDERVDYAALKAADLSDLQAYLDLLAFVDPAKLDHDEQLAFYINLYNATTIFAIAGRYTPAYSPAEQDGKLFKEPLVRLKSGTISPNQLRDHVIRPIFKDPRVHAAMVNGAISSPPILCRAYHGTDVNRLLDESMKMFITDRLRNPIDEQKHELKVSRIFDWFADDFGGRDAIAGYVAGYAGRDYASYKVSFEEYSWTLNDVIKEPSR
jgi:hypothetical protein